MTPYNTVSAPGIVLLWHMLRQKSDILSWFTPWEWPGDDPGGRGGGLRGGGAAIPGFPQDPLCGTAQERTGLTQTQLGKSPGAIWIRQMAHVRADPRRTLEGPKCKNGATED